jgi:hypothetical protein
MSDAGGDLPSIEFEPFEDEIDEDEIELSVQQALLRDEARLVAIVALVLVGVGVLFSLGWFVVAWRTQRDLGGADRAFTSGVTTTDTPDLGDRIASLEQIGILLLISLALAAVGCGLRLYASRVIATRDA